MYIQLTESVGEIESKINTAIADEINSRLKNRSLSLKSKIISLVQNSIISQPEIKSLENGYLKGAFGLIGTEEIIQNIYSAVTDSIQVEIKKVNKNLSSIPISISIQPSNFTNLLSLPSGHVYYENGDLHWLNWLLSLGDTIIVANYRYNPTVGLGRSGLGYMKIGGFFRVPPEFSGTLDNNFITRSLLNKDLTNSITDILKGVIQ